MQDLFWQTLAVLGREHSTLLLLPVLVRGQFLTSGAVVAAAMAPVLGLFAGLFGPVLLLFQALYTGRLAVRSGGD